jgi:hypothetical protein
MQGSWIDRLGSDKLLQTYVQRDKVTFHNFPSCIQIVGGGPERYDVPSVDLFGTSYQIGVEYRTEVDFTVEDMESVLSEKFVDGRDSRGI